MSSELNGVPWELKTDRTALLVVDMQNDFVNEGAIMEVPMARRNLPNMKAILQTCRKIDIPVVYTTHVLYDAYDVSPLEVMYQPWLKDKGMRAGTAGVEVIDELRPLAHETVVQKHRFDAFHNTSLETVLRNVKSPVAVDTLIIVGTVTDICCESTARGAFMRDFKVAFVSDACGGVDEESHEAALKVIDRVFGRVMSTEQLLGELQ